MNGYAVRKTILILALLLAVAIVSCLSAGPGLVTSYFKQKLISFANQGPLRVSVTEVRTRGLTLQAAQVRLFYPRLLTGFDLEQIEIAPLVYSLIKFSPTLTVSAQAYKGTIKAALAYHLGSGIGTLNLAFFNLEPALHPQLQAFGLESGRLTAHLEDFVLQAAHLPSGKFSLELSGVSIPKDTILSGEMFKHKLPLLIPRITGLNLSLNAVLSAQQLSIPVISSASSLGALKGQGSIILDQSGRAAAVDLQLDALLSQEGATLLALARQLSAKIPAVAADRPEQRNWRVIIKGPVPPDVRFEPL